jgi:hypothetical protein
MKKLLLVLLVPLALSAAAVAAPNPASATAHCKNLMRKAPATFGANGLYADLNACVTAKTAQATKAASNAAKACKAEAAADANAFAAKYDSTASNNDKAKGKSNGNAMGHCVSATARASTAKAQGAELNAAKLCKKERADETFASAHDGKTFAAFYGTNASKKNAFGKCVSKHAKPQQS